MRDLILIVLLALAACATSGQKMPRYVPEKHTGEFTTWWSDETPREKGSYLEGRRHGHIVGYHRDGSVAFEGDFEEGVPIGELVFKQSDGSKTVRETITDGVRDGPRTEYDDQGRKRREVEYRDGKPDGLERSWHPNGELAVEGRWSAGHRDGLWTWRDEQGALQREERYWVVDGDQVGHLETAFGPDGRPSVQTRAVLRDGEWYRTMTLWHRNGEQAGLVEYVGEMREGRDLTWDESGRLRIEGRRLADERVGTWRFWNAEGELENTIEYPQ